MSLIYSDDNHEYHLDGARIQSVTDVLQSEGFIDTTFMTDEGKERGGMAHLAVQYLLEGRLDRDSLDYRIEPYVRAAEKFVTEMNYVPQITERAFAHPTYYYGLKPDTAGTVRQFGNDLILIDWKTGAKSEATVLQMAGYVEGLRANDINVRHVYVIYLTPEGEYRPEYVKVTQREINVFLSALACANWKNNNITRRRK